LKGKPSQPGTLLIPERQGALWLIERDSFTICVCEKLCAYEVWEFTIYIYRGYCWNRMLKLP